MRCKQFIVALGMIVVTSPGLASQPEPALAAGAPVASADARYCLRLEAHTGSRIEIIHCETRERWAELGLDLDKEWPKEGVRIDSPTNS